VSKSQRPRIISDQGSLATLTAQLDAAQVGTHVRHVIAEMTSELMKVMGISGRQSADEVRRIRDVLGKDSEE